MGLFRCHLAVEVGSHAAGYCVIVNVARLTIARIDDGKSPESQTPEKQFCDKVFHS